MFGIRHGKYGCPVVYDYNHIDGVCNWPRLWGIVLCTHIWVVPVLVVVLILPSERTVLICVAVCLVVMDPVVSGVLIVHRVLVKLCVAVFPVVLIVQNYRFCVCFVVQKIPYTVTVLLYMPI